MQYDKTIMITGGAGFIGSHLVRHFVTKYPHYRIVNLDALTYAGNLASLKDVEESPNYVFAKADICESDAVSAVMDEYGVTDIIHLAAESHVDRSIMDPSQFVKTNVIGTVNLLQLSRMKWDDDGEHRFYHISTDEVYGELGETGLFTETTAYDPRSPYAASKAASDHFVRSFFNTYGFPIVISNCSNNYGPYQFPEKLIPLMIQNMRDGKALPVYGKGENVRDWLYVDDHVKAIDTIFHKGVDGETYNIGGNNEWKNIDVVTTMCDLVDAALGKPEGASRKLITFVKDRAGHDLRYAIDASKIAAELGWEPSITFEEGLKSTVNWYLAHKGWMDMVSSGEYMNYYEKQYELR